MISQLCRKHEIIVRPTQPFSPTQADTIHAHVGVGVVIVLVIIVVIVAIAVTIAAIIGIQIVLTVGIVVITARNVSHLAEIETDAELIRPLATKPIGGIAGIIALIIGTVGLCTEAQHLAITDRHDATMLLILFEKIGHGEVVELQTNLTNDTSLSPTQGEFNLVVAFLLQIVGDIDRSVLGIGFHIRLTALLWVEMSHGLYLT